MVNLGGRYEIRDGKRVLVERTKPAPDPQPKPKAPAPKATKTATKPAPTQSDDNVKEQDNG
ncbi:hypothetical protein NPJ88_011555 [Halomonas elongata]|uniref:hypothetical protein n=1 Tax=Halomonas elongata TaxID=2746 RepID=UPI00255B249E|nr:hypothetical protein [Halomonas elongata]MDL4862972.1 hypothetical protein [Halomonas elongata]